MEQDLKQLSLNRALKLAAGEGSMDIAKELLDAGADIHAGCDEPLTRAAENGHTAMVEFLLAAGAEPRSAFGNLPLRGAAQNGHVETMRALFDWMDRHKPPALG